MSRNFNPRQLSLPQPGPDAIQACSALRQLIHAEIAAHGGTIPFSRYMELALYAPRLGYYSGGAAKLGADGDFTTAPEMTPLFGATLAHVAAGLFSQTGAFLMEFGAGTGRLAFDILTELKHSQIPLQRYFIVELSGELRSRQEQLLSGFPEVVWLSEMPEAFSGVVLGNEVLDAMPVELLMKTEQGWAQTMVVSAASSGLGEPDAGENPQAEFICTLETNSLATQLCRQIPDAEELPDAYQTEVHPVAAGFMRSVSQMLIAGQEKNQKAGVAIFLDYGFPAHEYYLDQRAQGTLMCHYRHHAHPDPFYLPGLQDITAHVDFSAMLQASMEQGMDLLLYTSQAGFLLEAGIADILARIPVSDTDRYLPASNALQKLVSPAEMGELFKVLIIGCGAELSGDLQRHDRSHKL